MPVMARPSTLTPEITSQLCAARRVGATLKASAGAVGVPYRTLMDWLRLGRAEGAEGPYADLARGLDAATADLERVLMDRVLAGTVDDGRLALDALKYIQEAPLRRAKIKLARASAEVERKRASGEHVDRQRLEGPALRVYLPEES